jgi:sulfur-carrier protein
VKIKYFAFIRELAGHSEIEWPQPSPTLADLLSGLAERYGSRFRRKILRDGELHPEIIVLINGYDARHLGGANASLHPDDTVSIFPMVAGGAERTPGDLLEIT